MTRIPKIAVVAAALLTGVGCGTRVESAKIAPSGALTESATPASADGTAATGSPSVTDESTEGAAPHSSGASAAIPTSTTQPAARSSNPNRSTSPTGAGATTGAPALGSGRAGGANPVTATPGAPTPGKPASPAAPVPGASGEPIRIASIGVLSGPIGQSLKPMADSVRIWVKLMNDRGGLGGRPIVLFQADTNGDPARHRAIAQQMVEEKKVIAFLANPGEAFGGQGTVPYLNDKGVPVIGSEGAAQFFYESPVHFPQIEHGTPLIQAVAMGIAHAAKTVNKSKLSLWTCVEAQMCRDMENVIPRTAGAHGVQVVNQSKVSIGQPDFTAECLNARNAAADMIFLAADGASVSRAAAACARQGYRPTWMLAGQQVIAGQHGADPNLDGGFSIDTQAPWFLDNTPRRKQFVDVIARYAPSIVPTTSNMVGWVSTQLFELAAARAPQPLTREGLLASLASIDGDPLPDLTVPYHFSPGKPATPATCFWIESPRDGKWTSPDGGERHCFDYRP